MKLCTAGLRAILAAALTAALPGCAQPRPTVRVTDAGSGLPVRGARVTPLYPSFNGDTRVTDGQGIAKVAGLGPLLRVTEPYQVVITALGYRRQFVKMPGADIAGPLKGSTAANAGRREVILTPSRNP